MAKEEKDKKILIVDDDESIRLGFRETLKKEGFKVAAASSSLEAHRLSREFKPDLVILDYYFLNDKSGVDICKEIKENPQFNQVKMIMITGVLTKNQAQKMSHFGFDKILIKPVETKHLLDEINGLLGLGR